MTLAWTFGSYDFSAESNPEEYEISEDSRLGELTLPAKNGVYISATPYKDAIRIILRGSLSAATPEDLEVKLDSLRTTLNAGRQFLTIFSTPLKKIYASKKSFTYSYGTGMTTLDFSISFLCDDATWRTT